MKAFRITAGILFGFFILLGAFGSIGLKEVQHMTITPIDLSSVPDGTYKGAFDKHRWHYEAEITVKDHRIVSITPTGELNGGKLKFARAAAEAVTQKQSIQIDAVSGATVETKAFCKALENAFAGTTAPQPAAAAIAAAAENQDSTSEISAWANDRTYAPGETVLFDKAVWRAKRQVTLNTPPPDEWFWEKTAGKPRVPDSAAAAVDSALAAKPGDAKARVEPYNPEREYKTGESVEFRGSVYTAKRMVYLNTNPSDSWFWEKKR